MLYGPNNTEFLCTEELSSEKILGSIRNMQLKGLPNMFVSSPGGLGPVAELAVWYLLPRKATLIGGGMVSSAALNVFMCGAKRFALPDARFMFHEAFANFKGRAIRESETQAKLEILRHTHECQDNEHLGRLLEGFQAANKYTGELLSRGTKLTYHRVRELMRGDGCVMYAQEAFFYGLVHEIIPYSAIDLSGLKEVACT